METGETELGERACRAEWCLKEERGRVAGVEGGEERRVGERQFSQRFCKLGSALLCVLQKERCAPVTLGCYSSFYLAPLTLGRLDPRHMLGSSWEQLSKSRDPNWGTQLHLNKTLPLD